MNTSIQLRDMLARWAGAVTVALILLLGFSRPAAAEGSPTQVGVGQPMRVDQGERLGTVITVGADLTVLGEVEDDAVVIGGTLELGPDARVGGDAVAIGGTIVGPASARVEGDRVEISGTFGGTVDGRDEMEVNGAFASSFATFVQVVGSFLISALILAFVPRRVRGVGEQLRRKPGRSVLFGLAILLLFLPLLGALTISIVGIPLIPVAIMLLAAILVFGMTALALSIGYAMPFYSEQRSAMGALAIGYVIIALVALIPWVGAVAIPLASLYAGGGVLSSWFGSRRVVVTSPDQSAPPPPAPI